MKPNKRNRRASAAKLLFFLLERREARLDFAERLPQLFGVAWIGGSFQLLLRAGARQQEALPLAFAVLLFGRERLVLLAEFGSCVVHLRFHRFALPAAGHGFTIVPLN